uniref:Uncharacterized protein n=1 Tax=Parascaris equorum TaxID=6256 RepID=A0A914S190_PAREQ
MYGFLFATSITAVKQPSLSGPSAARLREISRQLKLQVEHEGKGEVVRLMTCVGAAYRAQLLVNRGKVKQYHRGKRRLQLHCRAMQCARSDYSS